MSDIKKEMKHCLLYSLRSYTNGKTKYSAPEFWQLFHEPELAKDIMGNHYNLIDLNSISDQEIRKKPHLGSIEFFMKHIYRNEGIKIWQRYFAEFDELTICDQKHIMVYIKLLL